MLAVDTETRGLIYREGVGSVFMVQWADAHGEYVCTEDTGWQPFLDAIERDRFLVFANASFDVHHLRASGIVDVLDGRWRVHDVQTLARVVIPGRFTYSLESLGEALLGKDATEQQRALTEAAKLSAYSQRIAGLLMGLPARLVKKFKGIPWVKKNRDYYALWRLEPELMEKYGKEDVRLTYDLWKVLWAKRQGKDDDVYRMEIAGVAPLLRAAEWEGVLVDKTRLAELRELLSTERDELRAKLLAAGVRETALGIELELEDEEEEGAEPEYGKATTAHLREDLLRLGVPLYKLTKSSGKPVMRKGSPVYYEDPETGKITQKKHPNTLAVDKDALNEFKDAHPVVGDLLAWRNRCKLLQTYVGPLALADPRVHTSFSQAAARTSRMSSRQPNMQNLPTPEAEKGRVGVRDVLVPGPGNCILACDYDSIEVRALAFYLANAELTAQLDAGLDMHQRTAFFVAVAKGEKGITLDDFVKGGPRDKDRTIAKVTTFTSMYGGGARLLAVRLGISVEEAAYVKQITLDAIPGYHEFDRDLQMRVKRRAFPHVRTITGRRLYVPPEKPYVALNTLIQGTSAELMKLGMIAAAPVAREFGFGILLVVHDELVLEGPAACAPEAQPAIVNAMESAYPLSPVLKVASDWSTDSYGAAK